MWLQTDELNRKKKWHTPCRTGTAAESLVKYRSNVQFCVYKKVCVPPKYAGHNELVAHPASTVRHCGDVSVSYTDKKKKEVINEIKKVT